MDLLVEILQFPPDTNSGGILIADVCRGLAARGHRIRVLTTFPHHQNFEVWPEYRRKFMQRERDFEGMDVTRLWVWASGKKHDMRHRVFSYMSFNLIATVAGLFKRQPDVMLSTNGSFLTGLSSYVIGLIRRTRFVYNVQDLYPEVAIQTGHLTSQRGIRFFERLERFMYARAAHITVITPGFKQHLLEKGVPAPKVTVIPNPVDTDFIKPLPKENDLARAHSVDDKFVVAYLGTMGLIYDFDLLLQAADRLRDLGDLVVLLVGEGVQKDDLQRKATEMELDNVRFLPFQDREHLPDARAMADVQVCLLRPGAAISSMPSKIYEILASGRPVLAGAEDGTDLSTLVNESGSGICVEPGDLDALETAIRKLHSDPQLRKQMATKGREIAESTFSRDAVVNAYEKVLTSVAEGNL